MGWSFHGRKRDVDAEKHLKRLHKTVPIIESPLTGADHENLVFSQRHEANTAELFFDLFFVANLATFTTYHSITDSSYLIAYIGFFSILWSSWFQVTLHDVRFARDSLYERVCKTIQFITFVGLALVGSSFNPLSAKGSNTNFRILCYVLVISRGLLAVQYGVVLAYIMRAHFSKLYLPLGLMIALYALAAGAFGAMTPAFRESEQSHKGVYLVWYVVMLVESIGVIAISSIWRMLSFKKTHLMERMSLLTLIVIGEGAIGVTKTVSRIMGKYGLEIEGCFLIMCIITTLVLIWALYFDNFSHGHYGTIRQQIWSLLHFPFQLAIVGVVEGSQQVALARYVLKNWVKIEQTVEKACVQDNLDGLKLQEPLYKLLDYWHFQSKYETYSYQDLVLQDIYAVGNATDICSPTNATKYATSQVEWPGELYNMTINIFDGVYMGLGMKLPVDKLEKQSVVGIAGHSWWLVYTYFWVSFCTLILCSIVFLILIRRHRADIFDWVSISIRLVVLGIGASFCAVAAIPTALLAFIASPGVLPTCLVFLFLVLFFDKMSALFANHRLRKSGQKFALEYEDEHHGGSRSEVHEHAAHASGHSHHDSLADHRKSSAWSIHGSGPEDGQPLTAPSTKYGVEHQSYAMTPLMSPPVASPPYPGGQHGNYSPLDNSQHYGA